MSRDNFSQLPNSAELQGILAAEAKRDIPSGKEGEHYFEFTPLIKLGDHFGVDTGDLRASYTREDVNELDLFAKGKAFIDSLKERLVNQEASPDDVEMLNEVYDYLAEEDAPEIADLIFVFGAKTPLRIEKAIDLYNEGLSKTLVVSGRSPHYADPNAKTEAEIYSQIARDRGVPKDAILTEDASITIPDNVRCSLNLLDEKGVQYNSIILVNSPYTQRRGWAHFKKYTPDSVKLIRVNSGTADQYKRDAWYKSQAGIDVVLSEYLKAKVAVSLNTA